MRYFHVIGVHELPEEEKQGHSFRRDRIEADRICQETVFFNREYEESSFVFIADKDQETVSVVILEKKEMDRLRIVAAFLEYLHLDYPALREEEMTFSQVLEEMESAERNDFLKGPESVAGFLGLQNKFRRRNLNNINYEDWIISEPDPKDIRARISDSPCRTELEAEYKRICAGRKMKVRCGHPVHYLLQASCEDILEQASQILLDALFMKKRLENGRCSRIMVYQYSEYDKEELDSLFRGADGGTILIELRGQLDQTSDLSQAGMESLENICECVWKYKNSVLTVFCLPRKGEKELEFLKSQLYRMNFQEIRETYMEHENAKRCLSRMAKEAGVKTDDELFKKLKTDELYLTHQLKEMFDAWFCMKLKNDVYPQYRGLQSGLSAEAREEAKGSGVLQMRDLIGLQQVKEMVEQILAANKAEKLFADRRMQCERPALHMVFTGNPGTAKTTVARLLARVLKENDILRTGQLIETGRGDLVGKYVGWTAPLIKKKFQEAKGGILFIDEAYSLVDDRDGSYGDEAINTIVQEMENHRKDVLVIFAGYPDKMEQFLRKNPGLRSRIAFHVDFPDYSAEELVQIAEQIGKQKGMFLTREAKEKILEIVQKASKQEDFGNGRFVRNLIEKARMKQAVRLLNEDVDQLGEEDLARILPEDIEEGQFICSTRSRRAQIGFQTS